MQFEQGYIYHIFNQGNNRQNVFFNRENYLYFLKKIWKYIIPYCDVLAYCLMPNHFHLMVLVNELSMPKNTNTLGASSPGTLGASSRRTECEPDGKQKLGVSLRHAES